MLYFQVAGQVVGGMS